MVEANRDGESSPARKYFSIDFFSVSEVYGGDGNSVLPQHENPEFTNHVLLPFSDSSRAEDRVAIIRSKSDRLIEELKMIGLLKIEHPDVTEESLRVVLEKFAESYLRLTLRPVATIMYDNNGSFIDCKEPTCRFHQESSCSNPKPMIFDDCPEDQWCMTYEPQGIDR